MEKLQNNTKYYKAILKGGHVGRQHYIEFSVYIAAKSKEMALEACRNMPRAKKDHKDFIISFKEISYDEFVSGREEMKNDPYLLCKNKQQQEMIMEQIRHRIKPDPHFEEVRKEKKKPKMSNRRYVNNYCDTYNQFCEYDCGYGYAV